MSKVVWALLWPAIFCLSGCGGPWNTQAASANSQRYGCDFDWDKDKDLPEHDPQKTILQPVNNLECGMRILDDQLTVRHERVLSKSSYWVTLRPGTLSFRVFAKQLANLPAACGPSRFRRQRPSTKGTGARFRSGDRTQERERTGDRSEWELGGTLMRRDAASKACGGACLGPGRFVFAISRRRNGFEAVEQTL